jgi:hypothetical protein
MGDESLRRHLDPEVDDRGSFADRACLGRALGDADGGQRRKTEQQYAPMDPPLSFHFDPPM